MTPSIIDIIDSRGLHCDHRLLLVLLRELGGEVSLKEFFAEVWRKGWYRWDFRSYPGYVKNTMVSPYSNELAEDIEYLEAKGLVKIEDNKIRLVEQ